MSGVGQGGPRASVGGCAVCGGFMTAGTHCEQDGKRMHRICTPVSQSIADSVRRRTVGASEAVMEARVAALERERAVLLERVLTGPHDGAHSCDCDACTTSAIHRLRRARSAIQEAIRGAPCSDRVAILEALVRGLKARVEEVPPTVSLHGEACGYEATIWCCVCGLDALLASAAEALR